MRKGGFSKVPTHKSELTHVIIRLDGFLDIYKMSNFQIRRKLLQTPFLKSRFAALCFDSRFLDEKYRCITFSYFDPWWSWTKQNVKRKMMTQNKNIDVDESSTA